MLGFRVVRSKLHIFRVFEVIQSMWFTEVELPPFECLNDAQRVNEKENAENDQRLLTNIEDF